MSVALTVVAVVVANAAAVAAAGALGAAVRPVATSLNISLGTPGAAADAPLDAPARYVAPGDTVERSLDVNTTASLGGARLVVKVSAPISSILDTNAAQGLRLAIDGCRSAWKASGRAPQHYSCTGRSSGPVTSVLARVPVARAKVRGAIELSNIHLGDVSHLRVRLDFPASSTNAFQGKTSVIRLALRLSRPLAR